MAKKRTAKAPVIKRMDRDAFWKIIDWSSERTTSCEEQAEIITEILETLEPEDIVAFENHFWECMNDAYRWDPVVACSLINGVCTDDGFTYFRAWMIAQGRKYLQAVLQNPDQAGEAVPDHVITYDGEFLLGVATTAYENKTGKLIPLDPSMKILQSPVPPLGTRIPDEEVPRRFPILWGRFCGGKE